MFKNTTNRNVRFLNEPVSNTKIANYGVITGTRDKVGGIAGDFNSGTILNCANYGDITGTFYVGNLIGCADECNLDNVLGTGSIDGLMCPVGGADVMGKVADLLGMAVANTEPKVAVVRCNGNQARRLARCEL